MSSRLEKQKTDVSIQIRTAVVGPQLSNRAHVLLEQAIRFLLKAGVGNEVAHKDKDLSRTISTISLYDGFFKSITGNDEKATLAYWAGNFRDLQISHFPLVETQRLPFRPKDRACLEVANLDLPCDDATAKAVFWSSWAIVAAMSAGASSSVFGADLGLSVLPVGVLVDLDMTADELVGIVRAQVLTMRNFAQTHMETVRRSCEAASSACDFRTTLTMGQADNNNRSKESQKLDEQSAIIIDCIPQHAYVSISMLYDTSSVHEQDITRLLSHLGHTLRWLVDPSNATKPLRQGMRIRPQDLDQIWTWNEALPSAHQTPVHEMIDAVGWRNPDMPAVQSWDGKFNYQQLTELSTALARRMIHMGVKNTDVIPLCFEKSMWTPVAMLAVMKSGAASLALDTTQPETHLRRVTEQVNAPMILSSVSNKKVADSLLSGKVVVVGHGTLCSSSEASEQPAPILPAVSPSSNLYIVFTSGSTGTPKGTMITHDNFSSLIKYQREALGIQSSSRVYDFASYAFDIAWCNALHTFSCGACLCIPSEAERHNDIEQSMLLLQVNYAHITPTLLRHLDWSRLGSLDTIVVSGEPVLASDRELLPGHVRIINAYGPAETNVVTIQDLGVLPPGRVSIGRGVGACTWIVDCHDSSILAPIGAVGELWLEGPLVGGGYFNNYATTRAVFIQTPSWLLEGTTDHVGRQGKLYRTGDLVRYERDGSLVYIARKDRQVKIRGQRLELGDVETHVQSALRRKDLKTTAECIIPRNANSALLAVFVSMPGSEAMNDQEHDSAVRAATSGLSDELAKSVPAFKVPSVYIPLKNIPLTVTGKTDRQQIRNIGCSMTAEQIAIVGQNKITYSPPTTDSERLMQLLWAEILHLQIGIIGVEDDFFELGGDSLGAMRLVSKSREQGLDMTVKDVFQNPRLRELSALSSRWCQSTAEEDIQYQPFTMLKHPARALESRIAAAGLCGVSEGQVVDILPCTPFQRRLVTSRPREQLSRTTRHVLELNEQIDLARLEHVWSKVVAGNPILRTKILDVPHEGLVQVILSSPFEWVPGLSLEQYNKHADEQPRCARTPFVRFEILQNPDTRRRFFVWDLDWAVYDGWSLRLLLAEAEAMYFDRAEQPLEPMMGFLRYLGAWDEAKVTGYWAQQFTGLEAGQFPRLSSRDAHPGLPEYLNVREIIPADIWIAKSFTKATYIRAAVALTIAENMESPQALFGAVVTGRQIPVNNMARVAGPTFAAVPLKIGCGKHMAVDEFLEMVQKQAINMLPYEQTGLEQIRCASRNAAAACDFRTLLVIQGAIDQGDPRSRHQDQRVYSNELVASEEAIVELGQRFGDYPLFIECQLSSKGEATLRICFDHAAVSEWYASNLLAQIKSCICQLAAYTGSQRNLDSVNIGANSPTQAWRAGT